MPRAQEKIQRLVSELLKSAGVPRPPVPVETIAENLEIQIRFEAAEDNLSGALIRKPREVVIGVNSAHHPNRQRFTIAHEIGHFILHKGIKLHVDEDFRVNLRDGSASREEIEANAFAAELLMPTEYITHDTKRYDRIDQATIQRLARRYQVSQKAMEIKLTNLGLVPPQ